jgi:hypothetical protein
MTAVYQRLDIAQIDDADLQGLLKRHIESTTGRKVVGDVEIEVEHVERLGRRRTTEYTAVCELADAQ